MIEQLLRPWDNALTVLDEVAAELASGPRSAVVLTGLHVLVVSELEVALTGSLRYLLTTDPSRMEFEKIEVGRADALTLAMTQELLEAHAEDVVRGWSFGPKDRVFTRFLEVARIETPALLEHATQVATLRERRNVLVHGRADESDTSQTTMPRPTQPEVARCVTTTKAIAIDVRQALVAAYSASTRAHALRSLWDYLFGASPLMPFDNFWVVDETNGRVVATKEPKIIGQLSGSERLLFGVWRAEFNGDTSLLERFSMKHLDDERRRDLVTLLAAFRRIWTY